MPSRGLDDQLTFLSRSPARPIDSRVGVAVAALSAVVFLALVPFAKVQLAPVWPFIPVYQSALATSDLITAVLLYAQFQQLRSRAMLVLAAAYVFTALMAVVHTLSFPGLFAPTGLLGATPQTTAWLYMFWHGGFPLMVIAYSLLNGPDERTVQPGRMSRLAVLASLAAVTLLVVAITALTTVGSEALPPIMTGNRQLPTLTIVVGFDWLLSLFTIAVLLWRRPYTVLDVWLMVVMVSWVFDIALSAMVSAGRFDVGFYAGRLYGLLAATFVLIVLLLETGALYAQLARAFRKQHLLDAAQISSITARLEAVLASSPLAIFSLDTQGRIAIWNSAAERLFGHSAAEVTGQQFSAMDEVSAAAFDAAHATVVAGKTLRDARLEWPDRDGRKIDILYFAAPIPGADGSTEGAVYVAEDITERLKLERQLTQAQKMDALGQLTGGVAHDFNNILTVITGTIDLLHEGVADRPQLAAISRLIDDAATRGADLTQQLLAFARRQSLQPRDTDLNALVTSATKLLRPALGEQIEIESALAADAWPALIDPSLLTSALLNLAINARDAMPDGGQLTLETRNVVLDETYAAENAEVTPGPYVMVAVSDTGNGIPPEVRDKVFDPFFTTKAAGKGTGLGLSMVFGFVKQSGGHIKIYSEVGHGTVVKMYLPRANSDAAAASDALPARTHGGTETILVVEDDRLVRSNVVMQLASLGYKTIEASDGPEALRLIKSTETIDLLFTDVVMPGGLNGRDLANQITGDKPGIRVLFTSGYTENSIVHHGRLDPDVLLLSKPYRKADLARMVRTALD